MKLQLKIVQNKFTKEWTVVTREDALHPQWKPLERIWITPEKWRKLHKEGLMGPEMRPSDERPMPQWTDDPTITGAYWEQVPRAEPDIVWIHDGRVFAAHAGPDTGFSLVDECVARGCLYYGPLPPPPPPPLEPDRSEDDLDA